jgi:hypothetical protein
MKTIKLATMILCLTFLSGCATLFGHKSDNLTIHSDDPNAKILVNGTEIGKGSATYDLPRDKTAVITAHKKGCTDTSVTTGQEVNNTTFLNLLCAWCYLIDFASGDIHEAAPTNYTVTPSCDRG